MAAIGRGMCLAFARQNGKNHAAEQFKDLTRGMTILVSTIDEASPASKIDLNLTKTRKHFKPKKLRIPDHVPYYVQLTRERRR